MEALDFLTIQEIKEFLLLIPERDRFVLNARFNDSRTQSDIGFELGISPTRVGQIESKALYRLRNVMRIYKDISND
jgi:RNA polymerase sigma factor for flagellar operon FliA